MYYALGHIEAPVPIVRSVQSHVGSGLAGVPPAWLVPPSPPVNNPPAKIPAGPIRLHVLVKPRPLAPVPVAAAEHGTRKGRPPQNWLRASGYPSGVLATTNNWHPNKWVGAGKAPLYKAIKVVMGLPVELGAGVTGNAPVNWPMQSRLTCLYTIARQAGVIVEIMPHFVRILSG